MNDNPGKHITLAVSIVSISLSLSMWRIDASCLVFLFPCSFEPDQCVREPSSVRDCWLNVRYSSNAATKGKKKSYKKKCYSEKSYNLDTLNTYQIFFVWLFSQTKIVNFFSVTLNFPSPRKHPPRWGKVDGREGGEMFASAIWIETPPLPPPPLPFPSSVEPHSLQLKSRPWWWWWWWL